MKAQPQVLVLLRRDTQTQFVSSTSDTPPSRYNAAWSPRRRVATSGCPHHMLETRAKSILNTGEAVLAERESPDAQELRKSRARYDNPAKLSASVACFAIGFKTIAIIGADLTADLIGRFTVTLGTASCSIMARRLLNANPLQPA